MTFTFLAIHLDDLGDIATVVAGVGTIALFLAAIWAGRTAERSVEEAARGIRAQIDEQRAIERRRRAYDHLGTFNSREFTKMSAEAWRVFLLFKKTTSPDKAWKKVSDSDRVAVQTVLNFYEEIANEYNAGFLDQEAAEPLVFVAVLMWQGGRDLIKWQRDGDRRYLDQWDQLYRAKSPSIVPIGHPASGA
jgi:hypothetical protein